MSIAVFQYYDGVSWHTSPQFKATAVPTTYSWKFKTPGSISAGTILQVVQLAGGPNGLTATALSVSNIKLVRG